MMIISLLLLSAFLLFFVVVVLCINTDYIIIGIILVLWSSLVYCTYCIHHMKLLFL